MKNNLKLIGFILVLHLFLPCLAADSQLPFPDPDVTISMDFQDASLKDILKIFSIQSGLNFIASEDVQDRKITLYLDKSPVKESMDKLFKANNLTYDLDDDSNIFIVKDWGKPQAETITKVYTLKYHPLSTSSIKKEFAENIGTGLEGDIVNALKNVISSNGKIAEDSNTNSLIITDIPARFPVIEQLIAKLDVPVPQVLIEVEMLDVSKNTVDKMGFKFGDNPMTLILPGSFVRRGAQFYFGAKSDKGKEGGFSFGGEYAKVLDFLRTQSDTRFLARPKLLTLNNQTAEISITKDEVVEKTETVVSGTTTTTATSYKRASELALTSEGIGVFLRVTPQVNLETGEITMFLYPKSSTVSTSALITTVKDPEVRSTKSIVKIRDGETIVVGGLIHQEKDSGITKIPILGDIPLVGLLFRHKNVTKNSERELIVFITPHILKEYKEFAQAKKISFPVREQNIGSPITSSRKVSIDTSLDRFEKIK